MRDYSFISPRSDEFALRSLARYSVQELSRETPFNELQRMFRSRCDEIISTILIRVMTKRQASGVFNAGRHFPDDEM